MHTHSVRLKFRVVLLPTLVWELAVARVSPRRRCAVGQQCSIDKPRCDEVRRCVVMCDDGVLTSSTQAPDRSRVAVASCQIVTFRVLSCLVSLWSHKVVPWPRTAIRAARETCVASVKHIMALYRRSLQAVVLDRSIVSLLSSVKS